MSAATAASSEFPRLAKYELIEEIGHGGMATVYRAKDPRLGREVAVKVIHRHLRANPEVGTRFVAEARAAAKLRHPGIVDVFDVSGEDDPERYLVVELVRGATLRKVLQDHRDMPAEVGAAIVLELCAAVEHAHASAIIHRDIKPENVLVEMPADREGQKPAGVDPGVVVKITDFGIAKILDAQGVTSTGQVLGSPAHMAPEQIDGGDVDARTDVFALGVLFYECLVGHLPFEGKNPAQVLRRVLDGTYPPADRERPSVGGRWSRVLATALAHDKDARIPSAAALGEQIRAELSALGVDDPHAELDRYFTCPADYAEAHRARLVPRLSARGEAARKAGDTWGAAADWNRALALAPDDHAVLKRIASLTSSAGRRQLARRAAAIVAGSAALGLGAFGVARALKTRGGTGVAPEGMSGAIVHVASAVPLPGTGSAALQPEPPITSASSPGEGSVRVLKPATPTIGQAPQAPSAVPPVPSAVPPSGGGLRAVKFSIRPAGAKLTVDTQPRSGWFREPILLAPGSHDVEAIPLDPVCCQRTVIKVEVPVPAPGQPEPWPIDVNMVLNPALVSLAANAPPGARLSCPGAGAGGALLVAAGATSRAPLSKVEWKGECTFSAPGRPPHRDKLTFRAGEPTSVPWHD